MKFQVLCTGLCCYTEGWGGKYSDTFATIKLLKNPRANKVFTSLHWWLWSLLKFFEVHFPFLPLLFFSRDFSSCLFLHRSLWLTVFSGQVLNWWCRTKPSCSLLLLLVPLLQLIHLCFTYCTLWCSSWASRQSHSSCDFDVWALVQMELTAFLFALFKLSKISIGTQSLWYCYTS